MNKTTPYVQSERLRSYSSVFTRKVFSDIINYKDFSHLNWLYSTYDQYQKGIDSYFDYLLYLYRYIARFYRCEYVYKNEIINQLLLKKYSTKNTIAFNEFRVGNSIVDFAMMNGESKAFEIKTQFDSSRRLSKQLDDYKKVFNKCYIVISSEDLGYYESLVEPTTGIIELYYDRGRIKLNEYRPAVKNSKFDSGILMGCLRTQEYKDIVLSFDGCLPDVSEYEMYDACKARIMQIPSLKLNELFLYEIKKRKSITSKLKDVPKELRQICLSLNLSEKERSELANQLCNPIKKSDLCIFRI
ncbi:MAG: sce7726 family protein [Prevotella sp.]|nr:sce7726 family protein [Prevotella sp.]